MSDISRYEEEIRDLSEKKLGDKQMRLAVALAEMFEEQATAPPSMMAVRVIDTIRAFNAAERRAKQGVQPKPKVAMIPANPLIEKLHRMATDGIVEEEAWEGLKLAVTIVKEMAGVE